DSQSIMLNEIALTYVGQVVAAQCQLIAAGKPGLRALLPQARVVLSPLEASVRGAITDLILATEEVERLRRQIEQLLADATGRPREQVRRDLERERVLDAQAAGAYGLADQVLFTRPTP